MFLIYVPHGVWELSFTYCIYLCVHVYGHMHACINIYLHAFICVCSYVCMYKCMDWIYAGLWVTGYWQHIDWRLWITLRCWPSTIVLCVLRTGLKVLWLHQTRWIHVWGLLGNFWQVIGYCAWPSCSSSSQKVYNITDIYGFSLNSYSNDTNEEVSEFEFSWRTFT